MEVCYDKEEACGGYRVSVLPTEIAVILARGLNGMPCAQS